MGKSMWILAWVCGLGLLALVFNEQLIQQYNPNQRPLSSYDGNRAEVVLQQNRAGHYVTTGYINGETVVFLVDTGATDVSVPYKLAQKLSLQPGRSVPVQTANGIINVAQTQIAELAIGNIVLRNIDANLNPGMNSDKILLGMSVLRQLEFTQRDKKLILRTL